MPNQPTSPPAARAAGHYYVDLPNYRYNPVIAYYDGHCLRNIRSGDEIVGATNLRGPLAPAAPVPAAERSLIIQAAAALARFSNREDVGPDTARLMCEEAVRLRDAVAVSLASPVAAGEGDVPITPEWLRSLGLEERCRHHATFLATGIVLIAECLTRIEWWRLGSIVIAQGRSSNDKTWDDVESDEFDAVTVPCKTQGEFLRYAAALGIPLASPDERPVVEGRECEFEPSGDGSKWYVLTREPVVVGYLHRDGKWHRDSSVYETWPTESAARSFAQAQSQKGLAS